MSILLVFLSNLWLVRSTDPDVYGLYVHLFNWVSILGIFVVAGRDDLVLALIPRYAAEEKPGFIVRLVKACNRWLLLATMVVAGVFLGVISLFSIRTLSENRSLFLLCTAAVYFTACLGVNQLILQAMNHIRLSQVVEKIGKPLLLILFIGLFHLLAATFDGKGLIVLNSIVLCVCSLVLLGLVAWKVKGLGAKLEAGRDAGHGQKTFYFFCVSLLNLLSTKIPMLILPYISASSKDIGILNICSRYADLLIFPFFLMHTVLPQLFARHSVTEKAYTQALYNTSNRLMTLLCLPLLVVIVVGGNFLLSWFGPEFIAGYWALVYISAGQFLFSFFGPANTILMMQGAEKYSALCLLAYVVVLAVACRLLIPIQGITGAALAMLLSSLFYNLLLAVVNYRKNGIHSPFFGWLMGRR